MAQMLDTLKSLGVKGFKDAKPITAPSVPSISSGSVPNSGSVSVESSAPPSSSRDSGSYGAAGFGSVLQGVGSVVGGILSYNEQKKANAIAEKQFRENLAFQKDQFYNAIQHRVSDAKKAGVHPLAALGISAHGSASPTAHVQSATGLGHGLQAASGAVSSYFDNLQRMEQVALMESQIKANESLSAKFDADTGLTISRTKGVNKDLANYHLYRVWDRVNNTLGRLTGIVRPAPVYNRTYNTDIDVHDSGTYQRVY